MNAIAQFDLIRSVSPHVSAEHILDRADNLLVDDITKAAIVSYEQAADRYTHGDITEVRGKIDKIENDLISDLLNQKTYHNNSQRMQSYVFIRWGVISKLLHLGHRDDAIFLAEETYEMAISCHAYNVASGVAEALWTHYGQDGDRATFDEWQEKDQYCTDQLHIAKDAKIHFIRLMSLLRYNKSCDGELAIMIETVVKSLTKQMGNAQSHTFWHCYYLANIYLYEIRGDFENLLANAIKGYKYFDKLPINHIGAKNNMLTQIVHGYNLLHRYNDALEYQYSQSGNETPNAHLLCLRLSRAFINTDNTTEAIKLLTRVNVHQESVDNISLYMSYCTGVHPGQETDYQGMEAAYMIAGLYCDIRSGRYDRHSHADLLHFIDQYHLEDTREGLIIEILSLLRYRHKDEQLFGQVDDLIEVMRYAPSSSTETEILRYETMLGELIDIKIMK